MTVVLIVALSAIGCVLLVWLTVWLSDRPEPGYHARRRSDPFDVPQLHHDEYPVHNYRPLRPFPGDEPDALTHHEIALERSARLAQRIGGGGLLPAPTIVPGPQPTPAGDRPGPASALPGGSPPAADYYRAPGPGSHLVTHPDPSLWTGHPEIWPGELEPWFYASTYEEACVSRSGELNIHDDHWPWLAEGQFGHAELTDSQILRVLTDDDIARMDAQRRGAA